MVATDSGKQNLSSEANSFPASQKIPRLLWNPNVHYRLRNSLPQSQLNPLHDLTPYVRVVLILVLSSYPLPCHRSGLPISFFSQNTLLLISTLRATWPVHLFVLDFITLILSGEEYKLWIEWIVLLDFIHRLVSQKNKQNWGIKNVDKISQCTRPQNSHKGQLLTTEQLTWVHTHINPWSKSSHLMTEAEPVSETLCRYFYKRLCLCAIMCLCGFYIGIWAPLACCGLWVAVSLIATRVFFPWLLVFQDVCGCACALVCMQFLCVPRFFMCCEVCSGWVTYCHRCLTCFKGLCVSGSVVSNWSLCDLFVDVCIVIFGIYIFNSSILFVFSDTRRWIKSKSTIRSILTHHRQNPTEIIYGK
jgi:hypothetical protein